MVRFVVASGGVLVFAVLAWAARPGDDPPKPVAPAATPAPQPPGASTTPAPRVREERADPEAFPPLPKTEPGDWLAAHAEPGQTFEEFRGSRRRVVTEERRTLYVLALDDTTRMGVPQQTLLDHLAAYYGLPAAAAHADPQPEFETRVRGGPQTLSSDVLRWLAGQVPSDAYCLLAVTTRDLYAGADWNFVFGEATLFSRVGVFSFARMDPAFPRPPADPAARDTAARALLLRRCLKVVTHEIGHMFGMEHCTAGLCLMNGSNSAPEMDRTPLHLCPTCVRKVAHACDLDVVERYRRLETFYKAAGLEAEATFAARRIARLSAASGRNPR